MVTPEAISLFQFKLMVEAVAVTTTMVVAVITIMVIAEIATLIVNTPAIYESDFCVSSMK